ncbi:hypothetical protein [Psychrobacillus antarcticus]|uniref:hypothetical protein n=1 Tax=Psychrobacillus antarcticus TaxID=2879115 RepID=UPI0024080BD1|nr:hypothetical protein [Psychrobacillus antarcticus]
MGTRVSYLVEVKMNANEMRLAKVPSIACKERCFIPVSKSIVNAFLGDYDYSIIKAKSSLNCWSAPTAFARNNVCVI